jgi:lysine-specific permease
VVNDYRGKEKPPKFRCVSAQWNWGCSRIGAELSRLFVRQTWCAIFSDGLVRVVYQQVISIGGMLPKPPRNYYERCLFMNEATLAASKGKTKIDSSSTAGTGRLERNLRARHLSMIAIGGSIGTGVFLASGSSIQTAGPGGALFAYFLIGIMVYFLMTSLGEMATYMPITGSFSTYSSRFVDPALGFAMGWNYWYSISVTIAVELVAGGLI